MSCTRSHTSGWWVVLALISMLSCESAESKQKKAEARVKELQTQLERCG